MGASILGIQSAVCFVCPIASAVLYRYLQSCYLHIDSIDTGPRLSLSVEHPGLDITPSGPPQAKLPQDGDGTNSRRR